MEPLGIRTSQHVQDARHTNISTVQDASWKVLGAQGGGAPLCPPHKFWVPKEAVPIVPTSQSNELRLRDQDPPEGLNSRTSEPQIVMGWKSRSTWQEPIPLGPSLPASPEAPSAVWSAI